MRPLYLKVEGLKSIQEEQSVNFERVAENGIFGVFGKTGSGKSTILDAIVLAIYGEVTENIENKEFVNKGRNSAKVDLLFETSINGKKQKFRVERSYHFVGKERKTLSAAAKLWKVDKNGDEYIVDEGTSAVTEKMKDEIIGLDKKDFLKCIALPQGQFSAFVKMTKSERLKVIGKLFDLEKYGNDLWRKASLKDRELELENTNLNSKKELLEEYSTENFKIIEENYNAKKQEFEKIKVEKEKSDKKKEKVTSLLKLIEERKDKTHEKEEKSAYNTVIQGYKQQINQFSKVALLKDVINNFESDKKNLQLKRDNLLNKKQKLESLDKKVELLNKEKAEIPLKRENITKLTLKLEKIDDLREQQSKFDDLQKQLMEKRENFKTLLSNKAELQKNNEKYQAEYEKYLHLSEEINSEQLLVTLSNKLSKIALSEIAKEEIDFLLTVEKQLLKEGVKDNESAVYQLIGQQIEKLKGYFNGGSDEDIPSLLEKVSKAIDESGEYKKRCERAKGQIENNKIKLDVLIEKMNTESDEGKKLKEESDEIKKKLESVLNGKSFESAQRELNIAIKKLNGEIENTESEIAKVNEAVNNVNLEIKGLETEIASLTEKFEDNKGKLNQLLNENSLTFDSAKSILSSEKQVEKLKVVVDEYEKSLFSLETRLGELNEILKDVTITDAEIEKICAESVKINEQFEQISEKFGEIKSYYQIGLKKTEEWCIINNNIMELYGKRQVVGRLVSLLKDNRFMEFVAEEYLSEIAGDGETRLLELTGGVYGLTYKNGNFLVTDNLRGGVERPIASLSGGETFLVSLSLALALSQQISLKALKPIDFFFLDEGFGTLDDDLIEVVTDSLEKLQKANLTVGLITHVTELKNRIQSKIFVTGATALHGTIIEDNCQF